MRRESTRAWLSGLAVTLTTIVSYLAFWWLSPGVTLIVGCIAFIALLVAAWVYGRETTRPSGKSPPRQSDRGV
jgi:hypothetical protein